jgi:transposase
MKRCCRQKSSKLQTVDLVASSGSSIGSMALELGLRDSVLRRWVELRGAGREPTRRRGAPQRRRRGGQRSRERENERLRMERVIFKKSVAIFVGARNGISLHRR